MEKMKHLVRLFGATGIVVFAAAIFAPFANATTPAPGYSQFAGCPSPTENAIVTSCLSSTITGGQLHLGSKETPIITPIILSGGTGEEGGTLYYNSKGGLSKSKQKVEGGVIGLTGLTWLAEYLGSSALTLYATAELAGTPIVHSSESITLPLKVHLENSTGLLGSSCYIGSSSSPVTLNLTTGTSGKLTGKAPEYSFEAATQILHANNGKFVDGTFTAPGANGCALNLFGFIPVNIDGVINLASGLPAGSGTNYTAQNYNLELVASTKVYP